ncbi:MAG: D-tyrosyl-tRNA(Tyr) deacylase [Dehalococcoidia bacterium]|nr:D-tyrosyl-tRNA(Tyr) deacylase [Dehalococcoidia bacterium]
MRALVQRVSRASVSIAGKTVSSIDQGLIVFVGVGKNDTPDDARYLADKVAGLRIFSDHEGKFNLSAHEISGSILLVSQFTLYASTRKGRRPSFTEAAEPAEAQSLIAEFERSLRETEIQVQTGIFQEHMLVEILNDGPVTIFIDSEDRHKPRHA